MRNATMKKGLARILSGALFCTAFVAGLTGCGKSYDNTRSEDPSIQGPGSPGTPHNPGTGGTEDDALVRGRWELLMTSDGDSVSFGLTDVSRGTAQQPMTGVVAADVSFSVSNANFVTPSADGLASYGSLDVTALRDNALRICGAAGNQKCTQGEVRIYTTGVAGGGLWSDTEGYGLPITTGATAIGLGAANAAAAGQVAIAGNKRVLKLADFTSAGSLQIPVAVDFTDAAAGSYSTTLVVEYVLR